VIEALLGADTRRGFEPLPFLCPDPMLTVGWLLVIAVSRVETWVESVR
jgi:hypothetical protein